MSERGRDQLRNALDEAPNIAELIGVDEKAISVLETVWENGAEAGEHHPVIDLIFGEVWRTRRSEFEAGLAALKLTADQQAPFRKRLIANQQLPYQHAIDATTELYVAGRLAVAGARVELIQPIQDSPTPDMIATRDDVRVTFEVASLNIADASRAAQRERQLAFARWGRDGGQPPEIIRRDVTSVNYGNGRGMRSMISFGSAFSGETGAKRVTRLMGKKADPMRQLDGYPNRVLVHSAWHRLMIGRCECEPNYALNVGDERRVTGIAHAAAYGQLGDVIRKWNFDDEIEESALPIDGLLRRERNLSGILWLYPEEPAVLLENQRGDAVVLDAKARNLVLSAFAIPNDGVSRLR